MIQTDPTITRNGETGEGRIYRDFPTDGPRSVWLFGATSAFDQTLGLDGNQITAFEQFAAFKFQNLQLVGDPTIDLSNNGPTILALIGVDSITSNGPGANLTFAGLDVLLLMTQNGPINLGNELSFNGLDSLLLYARGPVGNLVLGSAVDTLGSTILFSEGNTQVNGAQNTSDLFVQAGGSFLSGFGPITFRNSLSITAGNNIDFVLSQFVPGTNSGYTFALEAGNVLNIDASGNQAILAQAGGFTARGNTLNLSGPPGTILTLDNTISVALYAGLGGIQSPNVGINGGNLLLFSDGDIRIASATIQTIAGSRPIQGTIIAGGLFDATGDVDTNDLRSGHQRRRRGQPGFWWIA